MRVSEQVVALRPGVAFPSLPPSAPPFSAVPPGRAGPGPGNPRGEWPRSPGRHPASPARRALRHRHPLPRPPSRPSPGNVGGRRAGAAGGAGGRARPADRDAPGAPCPAPSGAGLPRAAGEHPPPRRSVRRGCGAAARTRRVLLLRGCASPRDGTARN